MQRLDEHTADQPSTNGHQPTPIRIALMALWQHIYGHQRGVLALRSEPREPVGADQQEAREVFFSWPDERHAAAEWLLVEASQGRETYHCAHLLTAAPRTRDNAAPILALWTDDNRAPWLDGVGPTAWIQLDDLRTQSHYRLTRPIEPSLAERLNRRLASAMGANIDGCELTQLLRSPADRIDDGASTPAARLPELPATGAYDPAELGNVLRNAPTEPTFVFGPSAVIATPGASVAAADGKGHLTLQELLDAEARQLVLLR